MPRRHWDNSERHIPLDDVRLFFHSTCSFVNVSLFAAPTVSPQAGDAPPAGPTIYRQDNRPQQQIFDLDLDLNPDL
jgi:hypothetical protein